MVIANEEPDSFHAYQSSLVFSAIFVLHLIFAWSSILSWMLFVADLGLIGLLTLHAYQDGKSLLCPSLTVLEITSWQLMDWIVSSFLFLGDWPVHLLMQNKMYTYRWKLDAQALPSFKIPM